LNKVQTHLRKELGALFETEQVKSDDARDKSGFDGLQALEKALRKDLGDVSEQDKDATSKEVQSLRQEFDNASVNTAREERSYGQSDANAENRKTQAGLDGSTERPEVAVRGDYVPGPEKNAASTIEKLNKDIERREVAFGATMVQVLKKMLPLL
jgi:hypothetical protein